MKINDRRTAEQKLSHYYLWVGTDKFMSGWGKARDGVSLVAWACKPENSNACESYVRSRGDMKRVRLVFDGGNAVLHEYRPRNCAHLSIYVFGEDK